MEAEGCINLLPKGLSVLISRWRSSQDEVHSFLLQHCLSSMSCHETIEEVSARPTYNRRSLMWFFKMNPQEANSHPFTAGQYIDRNPKNAIAPSLCVDPATLLPRRSADPPQSTHYWPHILLDRPKILSPACLTTFARQPRKARQDAREELALI